MKTKSKIKEYGAGIVELALVFPLILALLLGAIEFARELRAKLEATAISRQFGDQVFRVCWGRIRSASPGDATARTTTCLNEFDSASNQSLLREASPNATVVLSIYRCVEPPDSVQRIAINESTVPNEPDPIDVNDSKFTLSSVATHTTGTLGGLCSRTSPLIISEVFLKHTPLIPGFMGFFKRGDSNGLTLYGVTIF